MRSGSCATANGLAADSGYCQLQEEVEQQSEIVQEMLHSASTGAAKVIARKLLDTLKREAVAFEDLQTAQKAAIGQAPSPAAVLQSGNNASEEVKDA